MPTIDRLPAIPLIASDPYMSVWMPADSMTQTEACHWSGPQKPIHGVMTVDGTAYRFLGMTGDAEAKLTSLTVTPTTTCLVSEAGGVQLETSFAAPAFPGDTDLMSMPITLVRFRLSALDGAAHQVKLRLHLSDRFCYDGEIRPAMFSDAFTLNGQPPETWNFFNSARTVERLVYRTGEKRRRPFLDEDREFLPPDDLPKAGEKLKQEAVYYILGFSSEGVSG